MGKITFLGTGTSQGVPMIGCDCNVCKSSDPKDNRLRTSAFVEYDGFKILIDCGPDFREQMLRLNDFKPIDAVLVTHEHYDHVGGLDDLRPYCRFKAVILTHQHKDHTGGLDDIRAFNYFRKSAFPIYCESYVQDSLKMEYSYAFSDYKYPGVPQYDLRTITQQPFTISKTFEDGSVKSIEIIPIRVYHYKLPILGFRFGNMAYITDGRTIEQSEIEKLKGVDLFVINTVRIQEHISHFSLQQALDVIKMVGAPRNYLTHLSHQIGTHKQLEQMLPNNVRAAYDGLKLQF